ncbi:S41 family peptidase [Croceitalea marina]|uniref:S41 family peptidase n=1 Tax=Croceitalea marina TaxID=1775166 RepID=A0ABW5MZN3_9FLAO
MKKIIVVTYLCLFFTTLKGLAQDKAPNNSEQSEQNEFLLESMISLAKSNSYYASKVNWGELESKMRSISKESDSIEKLGKPAELMFKALGDFHGMLMYDYKVAFNHRSENVGPPNDSIYRAIGATKINAPYQVNAEILESENIAYIEILATGVMQGEDIAIARDAIRKSICDLKKKNPKGWIIDLRCNIGGNMNPMLAGLSTLMPNADLGGDTKDGKNFKSRWAFKDGNFYENGMSNYKADFSCGSEEKNGRIAVLTSKYTASSGEVVVSCLKGQSGLKVIGEKTSGLSSTNGWFVLSDKWVFAPMTAYFMSKDKTVHNDGVIPDVLVSEELNLDSLKSGKVIDSAIQWIAHGR